MHLRSLFPQFIYQSLLSDPFIPLSLLSLCPFGYFMFFLNIFFLCNKFILFPLGTSYCLYFLFIFSFDFISDYGPI